MVILRGWINIAPGQLVNRTVVRLPTTLTHKRLNKEESAVFVLLNSLREKVSRGYV